MATSIDDWHHMKYEPRHTRSLMMELESVFDAVAGGYEDDTPEELAAYHLTAQAGRTLATVKIAEAAERIAQALEDLAAQIACDGFDVRAACHIVKED